MSDPPGDLDTRRRRLSVPADLTVGPGDAPGAPGAVAPAGDLVCRRWNPFTGTPAEIVVQPVPGAPGPPARAALDALERARPALGLGPAGGFVADPEVAATTSGTAVVHLYQHHRGIPVFEMIRTVELGPGGRPRRILGENLPLPDDLDVIPRRGPAEAARRAAAHLADQLGGPGKLVSRLRAWQPRVEASFALPARPAALGRGPFEREVPAHLVVFGGEAADSALAWHLVFEVPGHGQVVVVVDAAGGGDVRYRHWSSPAAGPVLARVHAGDPAAGRRVVTMPPPARTYRLPLPDGFPWPWCLQDDTDGAFARVTDRRHRPLAGRSPAGGTVCFAPADPEGCEQAMLDAFYVCSLAHDLFELLGFDGASRNFDALDRGTGGIAGDPVVVRVHDEPLGCDAHMTTRPDGETAVMVLGRNARTGRLTALDADVVLHEYAHGVTTRLVGGSRNPAALAAPQSLALGEGWSDYFALTLQNHLHGTARTRLGCWSTGSPAGLRLHAYDDAFPDHVGHIGTGRYTEPHAVGEIWAAALVRLNRALAAVASPGPGIDAVVAGNLLGWRLVLDGLRLTRASPSFLDARDALLTAAADADGVPAPTGLVEGVTAEGVVRRVLAAFGLGRGACCHGPYLDGVVPCFEA